MPPIIASNTPPNIPMLVSTLPVGARVGVGVGVGVGLGVGVGVGVMVGVGVPVPLAAVTVIVFMHDGLSPPLSSVKVADAEKLPAF